MANGQKIFNLVRQNSSQAFLETVPAATADNIQTISNILFNDSYQPIMNEFITNLVNRIGLTVIKNKSFSNPLALLKKGSMPLGTDIQEIYTNPAEAEQYELSNTGMAKLLTITDPDTKVAYFRRNRQDKYTKTIAREALQAAFVSWERFEEYVSSIIQALYSANYIDEFKYTKQLVDGAYDNEKVITKVVAAPNSEANDKAFVKALRGIYTKMQFPSTEYNAYSALSGDVAKPVTTWTTPDRIVVMITADVEAEIDVEVLASAFNMSKADFLGRLIVVDKFENPEIQAVIFDESWFQIYDNLLRFDEFYNASALAWNEYLHAWGTYAISPFANAVMLVTAEAKQVETITIDDAPVAIAGVGETEGLDITLDPVDATSDIEYKSSDEAVFTVEKTSNTHVTLTATGVGEAKLLAKADNGVTAEADVEVTAE